MGLEVRFNFEALVELNDGDHPNRQRKVRDDHDLRSLVSSES